MDQLFQNPNQKSSFLGAKNIAIILLLITVFGGIVYYLIAGGGGTFKGNVAERDTTVQGTRTESVESSEHTTTKVTADNQASTPESIQTTSTPGSQTTSGTTEISGSKDGGSGGVNSSTESTPSTPGSQTTSGATATTDITKKTIVSNDESGTKNPNDSVVANNESGESATVKGTIIPASVSDGVKFAAGNCDILKTTLDNVKTNFDNARTEDKQSYLTNFESLLYKASAANCSYLDEYNKILNNMHSQMETGNSVNSPTESNQTTSTPDSQTASGAINTNGNGDSGSGSVNSPTGNGVNLGINITAYCDQKIATLTNLINIAQKNPTQVNIENAANVYKDINNNCPEMPENLKSSYLTLAQDKSGGGTPIIENGFGGPYSSQYEEKDASNEKIIAFNELPPYEQQGAKFSAWGSEGEWHTNSNSTDNSETTQKTNTQKLETDTNAQKSSLMLKNLGAKTLMQTKGSASSVKKSSATGPETLIYLLFAAASGAVSYGASRFRKG